MAMARRRKREFPLAEAIGTSATVRAEEIVMEPPQRTSVIALLSATPIRSDEGEVESMVVIIQGMMPLEEMERLRAEFLYMAAHELRMPLTSVWVLGDGCVGRHGGFGPAKMRHILDQIDSMRNPIGDLPVKPEPAEAAVQWAGAGTASSAPTEGTGHSRIGSSGIWANFPLAPESGNERGNVVYFRPPFASNYDSAYRRVLRIRPSLRDYPPS